MNWHFDGLLTCKLCRVTGFDTDATPWPSDDLCAACWPSVEPAPDEVIDAAEYTYPEECRYQGEKEDPYYRENR